MYQLADDIQEENRIMRETFEQNNDEEPNQAEEISAEEVNVNTAPETSKSKKKKNAAFPWGHDVVKLIELWKDKPCLYQTNLSSYKDKDSRANALKRIQDKLLEEGINPTTDDILVKIHRYIIPCFFSSLQPWFHTD